MSHRNGLELLKTYERRGYVLSTGDPVLDETMGGGILTNGITEVCGEAGAGKTQLCLILALQCYLDRQLGGLGSGTIYLCCGEGQFPARRLEQLATAYETKWKQNGASHSSSTKERDMSQQSFMNSVLVETIFNTDQVLETLTKQVPDLCRNNQVRLLILDSMAGLARTEFDSSNRDDMKVRTSVLFSIASKLKWLADTFALCVVVVNQVTAGGFDENIFGQQQAHGGGSLGMRKSSVPALGLVWSTCINTRLILQRHDSVFGGVTDSPLDATANQIGVLEPQQETSSVTTGEGNPKGVANGAGRVSRSMHLEISPLRPLSACTYQITTGGIRGIQTLSK